MRVPGGVAEESASSHPPRLFASGDVSPDTKLLQPNPAATRRLLPRMEHDEIPAAPIFLDSLSRFTQRRFPATCCIMQSPFVTTTSRIAPAAQLSFQIAARMLSQTPWPMWMLDRTCAPPLQGVRPSRSCPGQPLQKRPESAQRDGSPSTLSLRLNPHPALRAVRHQRPETN